MLWYRPSFEEWQARAVALFGPDPLNWRFVCPVCGHVASVAHWKAAGAPETAVAFSCVGRWTGGKGTLNQEKPVRPCNYAGGGLFPLNPVRVTKGVEVHDVFAFDEPLESAYYWASFLQRESDDEPEIDVVIGSGGFSDCATFDGPGFLEAASDWLVEGGCPPEEASRLVRQAVDSDEIAESRVERPRAVA